MKTDRQRTPSTCNGCHDIKQADPNWRSTHAPGDYTCGPVRESSVGPGPRTAAVCGVTRPSR